jgi:alcohol dehydrogenase class IV
MVDAFDFATAARILFRPGAAAELPQIALQFGTRVLIVSGRSSERCAPFAAAMHDAGMEVSLYGIDGEPTVDAVRWGVQAARESADVIIAFGGGSAIDGGKAIAILTTNSGDPLDYLEVVGAGKPLEHPPLPFIAVPTTAGTGSEVTRNAVLGSPEHGVKASLRSPMMLPKLAVVDPELTFGLPPAITASTGLDALTQLIEPYVTAHANAMVDLFCIEGMRRVAASLPVAYRDGANREARISMSFASLLGGLSLANAGLGVVHGFAAPLGGMFDAPHGALCAAVLPHGMAANIRALRRRAPGHPALPRYQEIARILTGNPAAQPEDGPAWAADLCRQLEIPTLRSYGVSTDRIPSVVEKAAKASSMKANPIVLTTEELTGVLEAAL